MAKKIASYALSCIVAFALYGLVLTNTYQELNVVTNSLLFIAFMLFALFLPVSFSIIGSGSLIFSGFLALFLYDGFNSERTSILMFVFLGELVGVLWKLKKVYVCLFFSGLSIISLIYFGFFIYPKIEKDPRINFNLTHLQDSSNYLIGHQNEHPVFNQDTVYLVNFSFQNCLPCRFKKKYLAAIRENFNGLPFKIIEIHTFENKKIFDESYLLDYPFVYHDSLGKIAKLYAITGGPEELIFNKKGQAVRRIVGFGKDSAETYLAETKKLILELTR